MKIIAMKTTNKKPLQKANGREQELTRINRSVKALKREVQELRALMRCLADAIQTAPGFLEARGNISAMEGEKSKFDVLIQAVLSKTKPRE